MRTKKEILKKYTGKGGTEGYGWGQYTSLQKAGRAVDSHENQRDSHGYLRLKQGDTQKSFGSKALKDPGFNKALGAFEEDKKLAMFG